MRSGSTGGPDGSTRGPVPVMPSTARDDTDLGATLDIPVPPPPLMPVKAHAVLALFTGGLWLLVLPTYHFWRCGQKVMAALAGAAVVAFVLAVNIGVLSMSDRFGGRPPGDTTTVEPAQPTFTVPTTTPRPPAGPKKDKARDKPPEQREQDRNPPRHP